MSENAAPLPLLTRVLIGPPGKVLLPVVTLIGLIILHDRSMPGGGPFELLILGMLLAIGTIIVWAARLVVALFRSDGRRRLRAHWVRWAAAPVMGAVVIGVVYAGLPFSARFALSESSLERFAERVAAGGTHDEQWVGLYPLTSIERLDGGGARFLVSGSGFLDRYGFAWHPQGPPQDASDTAYTPIHGSWYVWESRW